jgi:hypothetical protein
MGTFIVQELGSDANTEAVDSLVTAKIAAQRRARDSQRPVIVVDGKTGQEVARYEPAPRAGEFMGPVLAQLRDSHQRLQRTLEKVGENPTKKR